MLEQARLGSTGKMLACYPYCTLLLVIGPLAVRVCIAMECLSTAMSSAAAACRPRDAALAGLGMRLWSIPLGVYLKSTMACTIDARQNWCCLRIMRRAAATRVQPARRPITSLGQFDRSVALST